MSGEATIFEQGETRVTPSMRRGWQITSVVMLLICVFTGWEAHNLALFDRLGPGPGFFPFWLALIGGVLCAVILIQVTRQPPLPGEHPAIFPRGADARAAGAILGLTALAALFLDLIGFRITILLFSVALLVALGDRRWWLIALFAVIAGFGLFHLFNNWLDVLLPVSEAGI